MATPPPPTTRLGIAIDLDQLRGLMREFIDEAAGETEDIPAYEWRFERFLQWAKRKREGEMNSNILPFRVEKGTDK